MATYKLKWTSEFTRAFKRFMRKHPNLADTVDETLEQLQLDPFEPSLRLHNLSGELRGMQAISITYAYRIVLCVEIIDREVILHNIGSHDEVYG